MPAISHKSGRDKRPTFSWLIDRLDSRAPIRRKSRNDSLIRQIRAYDFSHYSDTALAKSVEEAVEDDLALVFAVVNESIKRRLGVWRLFDADFDKRGLSKYEELSNQIVESAPYKDHLEYYTDPSFLDSCAFDDSLTPLLQRMKLDADEQIIVKTMVYVAEKGRVDYWSNIALSAEFYKAASAKDIDRELFFHPSDEQRLAGLHLYLRNIVEMNAGEGKTIAAAFPAVAHALTGKSVHIITSNDYLAARDAELLAPVYESLGLSVGMVLGYMSDEERRHAYGKHIVYGTMREFGFDYLRDNLKLPPDETVQSKLDVVIVDEADHALIDQARTPLIISGSPTGNRRGFDKTKRAIEEVVALQTAKVRELESQLENAEQGSREQVRLLATLFLPDPENEILRKRFADNPKTYKKVASIIDNDEYEDDGKKLSKDLYYTVDSRLSFVTLTEKGQDYLEQRLGLAFDTSDLERELAVIESDLKIPLSEQRKLKERLHRRIDRQHSQMNLVYQMLRAYVLLKKNVDYLVSDDSIVLIDRLTGRTLPDNVYQKGLHAAIQAKEGVSVQPELETLAQISVPGFIKQYSHVSGMTGTATEAADEFRLKYGFDVVRIAPSQPSMRKDFPARLYPTHQDKLSALIDEVRYWNRVGRPVLVGTLTVEQSEDISLLLKQEGIRHNLLNAVTNTSEADIIRGAGSFGAVTISTNMAGRGTDIILKPRLNGQIIESYINLMKDLLEKDDADSIKLTCSTDEEAILLSNALLSDGRFDSMCEVGRKSRRVSVTPSCAKVSPGKVVKLEFGLGLHVIGVGMNESARVDRQLRGRSGRQGAFGSSRFMLSLDDDMLAFHGEKLNSYENRSEVSGCHAEESVEFLWPSTTHGRRSIWRGALSYLKLLVTTLMDDLDGGGALQRRLYSIQRNLERDDEAMRGIVRDYMSVIESQTLAYYRERQRIIRLRSFHQCCDAFIEGWARRFVETHFPEFTFTDYASQFRRLAEALRLDLEIDCCHLEGIGLYDLVDEIAYLVRGKLSVLRMIHGDVKLCEVERLLLLQTADELWRTHLDDMQEAIFAAGFSTLGHKSSVAEYAYRACDAYERFKQRVIDNFFPRLLTFPIEPAEIESGKMAEAVLNENIAEILV